MLAGMTSRDHRLDRATTRERAILTAVRAELSGTRQSLGLSRREPAAPDGVSEGQIARFEAGKDRDIGIGRLARLAAGVGLEASLRFYPDGDAVRDAGSLRLEARVRARIAPSLRWRSEVPVHGAADLRAW